VARLRIRKVSSSNRNQIKNESISIKTLLQQFFFIFSRTENNAKQSVDFESPKLLLSAFL